MEASFEQYCQDIQETAAWGGQTELNALANVLQHHIKVYAAGLPVVDMGQQYEGEYAYVLLKLLLYVPLHVICTCYCLVTDHILHQARTHCPEYKICMYTMHWDQHKFGLGIIEPLECVAVQEPVRLPAYCDVNGV